ARPVRVADLREGRRVAGTFANACGSQAFESRSFGRQRVEESRVAASLCRPAGNLVFVRASRLSGVWEGPRYAPLGRRQSLAGPAGGDACTTTAPIPTNWSDLYYKHLPASHACSRQTLPRECPPSDSSSPATSTSFTRMSAWPRSICWNRPV